MKKQIFTSFMLFMAMISCAKQNAQPTSILAFTPTTTISVTDMATVSIVTAQTTLDFTSQKIIGQNEKKTALYTYNQQVIDNGLSLQVEEVNPQCYKDLGVEANPGGSVRDPMMIHFIFKNLNSFPLKISNRFARAGFSPSSDVGSDLTTVFFFENGERVYTEGDFMFLDYTPGPDSFTEIPSGGIYDSVLEINIHNMIGRKNDTKLYDLPSGYYFVKFLYWSTQVERMIDFGGLHLARGISSNTIVICIE